MTILVADDEAGVRAVVRRQLAGAGYAVQEAATGSEALTALRTRAAVGGIELVIADVYMPDMDAIEFMTRMTKDAGDIPIVMISGGGCADAGDIPSVLQIATRLGAAQTLEKPFSGQELLGAVRAALQG